MYIGGKYAGYKKGAIVGGIGTFVALYIAPAVSLVGNKWSTGGEAVIILSLNAAVVVAGIGALVGAVINEKLLKS